MQQQRVQGYRSRAAMPQLSQLDVAVALLPVQQGSWQDLQCLDVVLLKPRTNDQLHVVNFNSR